jgi:hypothetical protein
MKTILAFLLMSLSVAWAGPITLTVDVNTDKKEKEVKQGYPSNHKSKKGGMQELVTTDPRSLEISLGNTTTGEFPNLKVVYYLFAKDVNEKTVVLAKKGDKTVAVASLGKGRFTSETVVMTQHSAFSKTVDGKTETTPAAGFKFAGYGVQVLSGNQLLAETFDPPELKASIGLPETSMDSYEAKTPAKKKAN